MPSQGSATQADGTPHGDASSYPSMADRRRGGGNEKLRMFSLDEEEGRPEIRETRGDKGEKEVL